MGYGVGYEVGYGVGYGVGIAMVLVGKVREGWVELDSADEYIRRMHVK